MTSPSAGRPLPLPKPCKICNEPGCNCVECRWMTDGGLGLFNYEQHAAMHKRDGSGT